ncbi:MAG: ribbon-helix-helix domain-containing protein [Acidobacteriia bacterium]|nr:ribbon-helix-helix domain-containing protein [Terriglobia bacterium]
MPTILVELDDATFRALNHLAPARKRQRSEFIRQAVKDAILKHELARMREAYRKQPDSASEADDWSNCEEFDA